MTDKKYRLALHVFRRDLRMEDNSALRNAMRMSEEVMPCFILDPRQLGPENKYRSDNAVQFMADSLASLDESLAKGGSRLRVFRGEAEEVLERLIAKLRADAVFVNRDHTPFSAGRDEAMKRACEKHGAAFLSCADALLHEPEEILKSDGTPYTVFTAFARKAAALTVREPDRKTPDGVFFKGFAGFEEKNGVWKSLIPSRNPNSPIGGRPEALRLIERASELDNYDDGRDYPAMDSVTRLSPHNKFGTVSIREVLHAFSANKKCGRRMSNELLWRDFFTHIAFHFPRVFGTAFRAAFDSVKWSAPGAAFDRWREGTTGFPIVDAGMRELASTGIMHNRVRMITASFLVKDLRIDWREGERHFASRLADYDPAVNNGNWQWCASTGCDAQPYFRIFNPWLQQAKYDPLCEYVKKWVPELRDMSATDIHRLNLDGARRPKSYPPPIVDHGVEAGVTKAIFKALARK